MTLTRRGTPSFSRVIMPPPGEGDPWSFSFKLEALVVDASRW
jgi:hypothetical protein